LNANVYDIAVIGSGFAGSLLASIARRLGRSVILLEKGRHPRFAIGESSTPLANLLLDDLTTRYDLPALKPLAKWGTWQQAYPQIHCGLKRGFTFYHHTLGEPAACFSDRTKQLLVAASPHDKIADTHWYRADFDEFFVREAQNVGVEYIDEIQLNSIAESEHELTLHGTRSLKQLTVRARFVVDATGPHGFLHRTLNLPETPLPEFPATQALYSHFSGVRRPGKGMSLDGELPPYPVEEAAVHHLFEGGWVWVLHFNNGITSAGAATTDALGDRLRLQDGEPGWQRLLHLLPHLQSQFADATLERSFTHVPRLSFRSGAIAGKRWVLLPSAAGFVDPLLSTGFTLTLLGVTRLAEIIEQDWNRESFAPHLQTYAVKTDNELLASARLIGALYGSMSNFPLFTSLSLLYFAAVSYSETVRRLGKPQLAPSFLLHDHPSLGPQLLRLFDRLRHAGTLAASTRLNEEILAMIEPFNVAGLGDTRRRNWYPVEAEDLLRSASKVEATREEIAQFLDRSGFWPSP
jgi:tetracycline 7-halogenase / FADH2 O2-dependent halogenase